MKRMLALLLLLCTVFSLFACSGGGGGGGGADLSAEPDPIDAIPEGQHNFRGDTLYVSIRNDYVYEIYADATSQEGIDPEIYKRNQYTENRFNFKLRAKESLCKGELDGETHLQDVKLALQKQSFNFDVIFMWAYQSGKLIKGMNYLDWRLTNEDGSYLIPYAGESLVNEAAWWPAEVNRASTVMGHQYIAVSDMSISSMESAYSIVFNQNMVLNARIPEQLGYRDMYDIVDQGHWTLDVLYGITKDVYVDNVNTGVYGTRDEADTYGFMYQDATGIDSFINSLGFQCVVNDGESMPRLWTMTQTLVSAAEDVRDLCNSAGAVGNSGTQQDYKFFAERHAYFATMKLAALRTATMHAMEDDYGNYILPYTGESLVNKAAWWPAGINDASTVMGHQYIAISDMSISSMESAYSIVYNFNMVTTERIAENLGYRDMYDIVTKGDWTLDLFYNLTKDTYKDNPISGTIGQPDLADTYGFMYQRTTGIDAFINSLGFQCIVNDGENMPTLWTMNQTLTTAAEDVVKLCTSKGAIDMLDTETDYKFFAERHAYFATMKLAALRTATMHGMEDDYGVLPYPKLNKAQKEYLTGSDDHCSVFSIPLMIDPSRYEIIGVTMEALSARTNQVVKKQFYDTMLKTNSTRNLQDEEMIDMIINGRVYDFVTYHHADLWIDPQGTDGHLHAFFRYLTMQEPGLSPGDYWARGKDILSAGESVEGSLANLIYQYVNMLG